jgi:hypothetical protein
MRKIDYKKELHHLYNPSAKEVVEVVVPAMNYLMVDGEGDPNSAPAYAEAVEALFALSYALKFKVKKSGEGPDYTVMPLEGLWWADDMTAFSVEHKGAWKWTMMIMQPAIVTEAMVNQATVETQKKKNPAALAKVRFASFEEGRAAQIMHIGPFSAEGPTIEKIHHFIEASGHTRAGTHHEIYLSDIRKADPAKWKTIIRQPM